MKYYRTDVPHTAAELFDGELVIANYDSGIYYSVASGGALIWQALRHGLSDAAVTEWLATGYPAAAVTAPQVTEFIDLLQAESLLIPVDAPQQGGPLPELPGTLGAFGMERFEDLQELLLLDPVHDVDTTGWPHRAEDDTSR